MRPLILFLSIMFTLFLLSCDNKKKNNNSSYINPLDTLTEYERDQFWRHGTLPSHKDHMASIYDEEENEDNYEDGSADEDQRGYSNDKDASYNKPPRHNHVTLHNDGMGNTTGYDSDGNYYYYHTDKSGNTVGHDSKGNFYYSHTDNFGNTVGHDSKGNSFNSHTDKFGNTFGSSSNGSTFNSNSY